MIIECATCPVRGLRCEGCLVTALAGVPVRASGAPLGLPGRAAGEPSPQTANLDAGERRVVGWFVAAGLIDAEYAASLRARRDPPVGTRAVG